MAQISCHVDDFKIAAKEDLGLQLIEKIKSRLRISKVEKDRFRFTGIDFKKTEQGIEMSMEDYAKSVTKIDCFRHAPKEEKLTKTEMALYRRYVGKVSWLASNCRPDLAFVAQEMSQKACEATLADLKKVNSIVDRIKSQDSRILFRRVGNREDLEIRGVSDAAYSTLKRPVGGRIVMLANKKNERVCPVSWKSVSIRATVLSTKDAETRSLAENAMSSTRVAKMIETLLFGNNQKRISVKNFADNRPLLESVASTRTCKNTDLTGIIRYLKDKLENGEVASYNWLPSERCVADFLTKEMKSKPSVWGIFLGGVWPDGATEMNQVVAIGHEFKMLNPTTRDG